MLPDPLLLRPHLVEKVWGGRRLERFGRELPPDGTPVGESWDVVDLPADDGGGLSSVVVGGPADGLTLAAVLQRDADALVGGASRSSSGGFPLLVKLLDAAEDLSVQVHPTAALAPTAEKSESWVVLEATSDAQLLLGFEDDVAPDDVVEAAGTAAFVELCRWVDVRPGDVVDVPAGTLHALGAGVLVAEVQTPSDVTYRLWDWADRGRSGRELHVERGVEALLDNWDPAPSVQHGASGRVELAAEHYDLLVTDVPVGHSVPSTEPAHVVVVTVLSGRVAWDTVDGSRDADAGTSVVVPAACVTPLLATDDRTRVLVTRPR